MFSNLIFIFFACWKFKVLSHISSLQYFGEKAYQLDRLPSPSVQMLGVISVPWRRLHRASFWHVRSPPPWLLGRKVYCLFSIEY